MVTVLVVRMVRILLFLIVSLPLREDTYVVAVFLGEVGRGVTPNPQSKLVNFKRVVVVDLFVGVLG